jgi:hypothetical protein
MLRTEKLAKKTETRVVEEKVRKKSSFLDRNQEVEIVKGKKAIASNYVGKISKIERTNDELKRKSLLTVKIKKKKDSSRYLTALKTLFRVEEIKITPTN